MKTIFFKKELYFQEIVNSLLFGPEIGFKLMI
jgi:hypothetical protein